eukprot:TRINITY_DN76119_c0_g1_i1.p2 TRINITY_DN76119_c0_g1~~TRINITY_DN76119_c0_g1_i1.p2  ORF type:complete len:127 (+),score=34.40 TRINITY_DN76119_c0_g1_i1:44-424(+)
MSKSMQILLSFALLHVACAAGRPAAGKTSKPREVSLIESLAHMGSGGKEAVTCVTSCRWGERERHPWRQCLDRCVSNQLMRTTLLAMLPEEDHAAPAAHAKKPDGLEVPELVKKKLLLSRMRATEL